jgi:hypothetical protein
MRRIPFRYVLPAANLAFVAVALNASALPILGGWGLGYASPSRLGEFAGTINLPAAFLTAQVDRLFDLFMRVYPHVPPWRAAFDQIFLVLAMILQWFLLGWWLDRALGIVPRPSVSLGEELERGKEMKQ